MVVVDGKEVPVYKDPITDPGKKSKEVCQVFTKDNQWITKSDGNHDFETDCLKKF